MRIKKLFYALVPMLFLAMGACQEEPVQAPAINLNEDEISIGAEGGESSVLIKPTRDWTATVENGADWLTVNPASGSSADVVVEVKVVAEANEGDARSAKITFTAANIEEVLTVSQAAVSGGGNEPGGDDEGVITVEEFLSKPVDGSVYYRLKGTITDLFNTEYGNFHLVDSTGDVLVYGLTAEKQSSNDKTFSTLGLEEGDIVILEGTRDEYNGEPQVGGAYYISHEDGQGGGDEPEPGDYTSIADVRKMAPASTDDKATIADGVKIKAYVISNVEINNLTSKKNVFVQDETAGLQIRFTSDATFAFGDEVVIDLSGQELSYFDGALQANNVPNGNVEVLSSDNKIDPKEVTVAEFMKNTYDAQYVALPDVQVVEADLGKTFVEGGAHTSINVEDKTGNSFVIFSSKYTTFGNEQVPQGAGVLKGISMINNGKMQIGLTSQDDYAGMTGERFEAGGGDDPQPGDYTSLSDIRALAPNDGDKVTVDDGVKVKAFVISNREINNLTSLKNAFIQDETAGIQVRFTSNAEFDFGDEVEIDLSGQELSYYDGALQVNNLPNSNVKVLSEGNVINAKEVSVADFMNGMYDAQYVALPDVQVVEADLGKTFVEGGAHTSINVEDITGHSFAIFSSKYTTFGNEQVPQGAGVLKGISTVNKGNMQINLTSQSDYAGMTGERFDGQGGDDPQPGEIEEVTIEEFLAKSEGETYYKLTGTVTSIKDDSWGNLTIEDETGNVYVYGVAKDEASVGSGPSFSGLGVEVGDILTIAGKRASFNGSPQVGDAYYISHEKGQGGGDDPKPGEIEEVTVSEFLSKPVDGSVYYRLTGTITDLYNTEYGNFTLVDETGSVLVYGLTAEKVSSNDKSFSTLGLKEGDIVTLEGTRAEYNGEAQVGGPAYYISHEEGETPDIPEGDPKALVISEYSEGKSFNKFLEITNVSGNEIDLSAYTLRIYTNGNESSFKEQQLSGTLAAGASKVYMHSDADVSLLPAGVNAEAISDNVINFNGDDPMAIVCNGEVTDLLGTFGDVDYGKDTTLRRKSTVTEPSAVYNSEEWEVLSFDDLSGFGSYD